MSAAVADDGLTVKLWSPSARTRSLKTTSGDPGPVGVSRTNRQRDRSLVIEMERENVVSAQVVRLMTSSSWLTVRKRVTSRRWSGGGAAVLRSDRPRPGGRD